MKFISLFAGIGGFDLGCEMAGWQCVYQCEIDPFCRAVLAKHWPNVPRHDDVRTLTGEMIRESVGEVDAIIGGFPCQDVSNAGKRAGINGARSGLWSEYFRLVCEIRPRIVVVENVAALLIRGIDRVLGDMASVGYDAEWEMFGACAVGAPHHRQRVWILGQVQHSEGLRRRSTFRTIQGISADKGRIRAENWCKDEPEMAGMVDGIPGRMDRLKSLGNAVVPQCAYIIAKAILEAEFPKSP